MEAVESRESSETWSLSFSTHETEIPYTYSAGVRHVTSTWAVIIQARIGSASIRAVRHRPTCTRTAGVEEGLSASRSNTSDSKYMRTEEQSCWYPPTGFGTHTFLVHLKSKRATPWCTGMKHDFRVMSASPEAGGIYDSSFMAFIIKHNIDSSLPFSTLIYLICESLGRWRGAERWNMSSGFDASLKPSIENISGPKQSPFPVSFLCLGKEKLKHALKILYFLPRFFLFFRADYCYCILTWPSVAVSNNALPHPASWCQESNTHVKIR